MTEEIEYPEAGELFFWWSCYRKVGYATQELAEQVASQYDRTIPYRCEYGDHWHNGREATGSRRKGAAGPSALRQYWRRQQVKPSLDELAAAFAEKRPRVLVGSPEFRDLNRPGGTA